MIVDKQALVLKINQQLADNSTQEISPRDIRDNLLDIIDSAGYCLTKTLMLKILALRPPEQQGLEMAL